MRRREVIKKISDEAKAQGVVWGLARHGANHDVYRLGGRMIPIARHREFVNLTAEVVWRECEAQLGKDWWR